MLDENFFISAILICLLDVKTNSVFCCCFGLLLQNVLYINSPTASSNEKNVGQYQLTQVHFNKKGE